MIIRWVLLLLIIPVISSLPVYAQQAQETPPSSAETKEIIQMMELLDMMALLEELPLMEDMAILDEGENNDSQN